MCVCVFNSSISREKPTRHIALEARSMQNFKVERVNGATVRLV